MTENYTFLHSQYKQLSEKQEMCSSPPLHSAVLQKHPFFHIPTLAFKIVYPKCWDYNNEHHSNKFFIGNVIHCGISDRTMSDISAVFPLKCLFSKPYFVLTFVIVIINLTLWSVINDVNIM